MSRSSLERFDRRLRHSCLLEMPPDLSSPVLDLSLVHHGKRPCNAPMQVAPADRAQCGVSCLPKQVVREVILRGSGTFEDAAPPQLVKRVEHTALVPIDGLLNQFDRKWPAHD